MVLADSTRARPRRAEQDQRAKPRGTNPGTGAKHQPEARFKPHAARPTRAQAKPARPTTDSRGGVVWQVPGLRPPANRRLDERAGPTAPRAPTKPGHREGKVLTPRAPLWDDSALVWKAQRQRLHRSGISPGEALNNKAPPFTFITPLGLVRPMTRTHVRLLGPCFKTGRVGHRPFARRERRPHQPPLLHDRRRAARTPDVSPLARQRHAVRGTSRPGPSASPATGRGDLHHGGKYARRRRLRTGARPRLVGSPQRIPRPADNSRRAESPRFDLRGPTRLALNGFTYS